jgi:hypothetical protein
MKTNKHQTLLLVKKLEAVRGSDLEGHFGYSAGTARSYLSYLARQGLLERMGAGYELTHKGRDRVHHFDIFGCLDAACPLCQGKAGYVSCPHCGHRRPRREMMILKEKNLLFVVRHKGVYCDHCLKLIFNESQARLLGIREQE